MYCFIVVLAFFILVFNTYVQSREDVEVIFFPIEWNSTNTTVPLSFTAFGKKIDLLLQKNKNLLSENFEVWKREKDNSLNKVFKNFLKFSSCHYLHEDSISTAAVSLCDFRTMHGYVFFENGSLEISPLSSEKSTESHRVQVRSSSCPGEPHVIRKRRIPYNGQNRLFDMKRINILSRSRRSFNELKEPREKNISTLTIELAVFLDAAAYGLFVPHVAADEGRLLDVLLAYVNNIQALYHHPSLGRRIDVALVRMELMSRQPEQLQKLDGERSELLDAFCAYSKAINPPTDEDPHHWDIGLYVSGLDFYAIEEGKKNSVTMGLAPVGGVCWSEYSCVIAEFGVTNRFGKPYPSAGFTSIYIAAHEIAHNLGMHHDSARNDCPQDGYIMSPSRGTEGETQWSNCSRAVATKLAINKPCLLDNSQLKIERRLDHKGRFGGRPGKTWTAKRQCEILLRDPEATVDSLENCCRALRCRSPERTGFYLAGPALDGTRCSETGHECRAGECLPTDDKWQEISQHTTTTSGPSGWSEWSEGQCESGCIRGSLGYLVRRRTCQDESTCPGLNFDVSLCKDTQVCEESQKKRLEVGEFAGRRCLEYSERLPEIDGPAGGLQAVHEEERPWMACAVFCKMRDASSYYSPRLELNDLGVDPYFPDGTWCHKDDQGENYFCRRHHCLPENFRFGKGLPADEEEALGPMNAEPPGWHPPQEVGLYFGLGMDRRPLLTSLRPRVLEDAEPPRDGESWLDSKDYVELPAEFLFRHPEPRADSL